MSHLKIITHKAVSTGICYKNSRHVEGESISLRCAYGGMRWRSWLRHCATRRKVAGSILDGVIEIFHEHNPSGRNMALGSTQPLKEMSTRNISWERKGGRCVGLTTLSPARARFSWNLGAWTSWNSQGLYRDCFFTFAACLQDNFCESLPLVTWQWQIDVP